MVSLSSSENRVFAVILLLLTQPQWRWTLAYVLSQLGVRQTCCHCYHHRTACVLTLGVAFADPDAVKIDARLCVATAAGTLPLLARLPSGCCRCRDGCELRGLLPA